jgi:hypothetical protein
MTPDPDNHIWPYEAGSDPAGDDALALERAFAACFRGPDGALVIRHLRKVFLHRRVSASATDAELRHTEGQRSLAAHVLAMIEKGRG